MNISVAIVGRPNVGKSTLFNRLAGRRLALVDDQPGVTRDRREADASLGDLRFRIIDTAGLDDVDQESLEGRMRAQTEQAIRAADVCLFVMDARSGVTPLDNYFAEIVRKTGTPTILLANKCEGGAGKSGLYDAFSLGLGDPIPLSAEHGEGTSDLHAALKVIIPNEHDEGRDRGKRRRSHNEDGEDGSVSLDGQPVRVAIIGRPNAGKSSLVNTLIGEDRLLTGPEAGITRDSIAIDWQWNNRRIKLFDTAGLRKKARVVEKLERLSVNDALRAVRFAELVILVIDATQPFEKQDLQIADLVSQEGRALVIAVNKWDLVEDRGQAMKDLKEQCSRLLPQMAGVSLVPISALSGFGLDNLMTAAFKTYTIWNHRVSTAALNDWLHEATQRHNPPASKGRRLRLRYMTQAKTRPPTFVVFCSRASELPDAYVRYLINSLRDSFDLPGVPIRLFVRKGKNPYVDK